MTKQEHYLSANVPVVVDVPELRVVMTSSEDEAPAAVGDGINVVRDVVVPVVTVPGEIIVKVSLHETSGERCWHSIVICSAKSVANNQRDFFFIRKGQTPLKETC